MIFRADVFSFGFLFGEERETGNRGPDDRTQNYTKSLEKTNKKGQMSS